MSAGIDTTTQMTQAIVAEVKTSKKVKKTMAVKRRELVDKLVSLGGSCDEPQTAKLGALRAQIKALEESTKKKSVEAPELEEDDIFVVSNFGSKRPAGFRVTTKKLFNLTTIKVTTIYM